MGGEWLPGAELELPVGVSITGGRPESAVREEAFGGDVLVVGEGVGGAGRAGVGRSRGSGVLCVAGLFGAGGGEGGRG